MSERPGERPPRERPCPICGVAMAPQALYGIVVDLCRRHGLWADRGELRAIRRRIQVKQQTLARLGRYEEGRPVIDWALPRGLGERPNAQLVPEGQRPCPVCGQYMATEERDGVNADICREHGIWLDRGELYAMQSRIQSREVRLQAFLAGTDPDLPPGLADVIWILVKIASYF